LRVGFGSLLGDDLAVEGDAAGGDDLFGFAAGGDAGGGEDFLEAGGHGDGGVEIVVMQKGYQISAIRYQEAKR
jgi:hypothetical protein